MERDYELIERLSRLGDDVMVGVKEVSALTGLSHITVQQHRTKLLPPPIQGTRPLRWWLGDIRGVGRAPSPSTRWQNIATKR